ncbi:MAG: DUF1906 domain-containing protein [Pyrinomonadaceae bacterium]|nr:DUF1906 domain-containing protein [Pyrinomonadaceae bacterium]
MRGISTHLYTTEGATCIKEQGYDFVFRYYSEKTQRPQKVLRREEAEALSHADLKIGVVYQDYDEPQYINASYGRVNGLYAFDYARSLNQPPGSAIYFAIDYDPRPPIGRTTVPEYFRAVHQAFMERGNGTAIYEIGVYGSGAVCGWLRANLPFVKYSWLGLAPRWWGYEDYRDWNIKQFITNIPLCGLRAGDWEMNEAQDDFGAFMV